MIHKRVSIVIPVYNAEHFIQRCIDSIIEQTYQNWEIIAVNDGSSDDSLLKLQLYETDPRIKIINIPNGGVVNARNTGVKNSSGQFLMFVDADDFLPKDAVASMVEKMYDSNVDLVVGGYTLLWEGESRRKDILNPKKFVSREECIAYCIKYGETFLPVKLYRTELFKAHVNIPEELVFMEDTVGILQYLSNCKEVASINRSVYVYYKNSGSASMRLRPKSIRSLLEVADFILLYQSHVGSLYRELLIEKAGDLLLLAIGNIKIARDCDLKLRELLDLYFILYDGKVSIKNMLLSSYRKHSAIVCELYKVEKIYYKFKSNIKGFIWRMIH